MTTIRRTHLVGKRVQLQYTNDPYTNLKPGDIGTVNFVDDMGTIHVDWDNGSKLGILPNDGDRYVILTEG